MNDTMFDIAVVGGGPAGLAAAISAASQGLRVALCEAKTYPHDKMCGEFLSPECRGLLSRLELDTSGLGAVPIHTARVTAPSGVSWQAPLPGEALGLSRRVLDAALAERARQAGVEVRQGTPVRAVQGDLRSGFCLDTPAGELFARAVIGAQGKRSAFDRTLDRRFLHAHHPFVAVKAHFNGPPLPGRIELHAFPGGYCGLSEIEQDGRVVCFLVHERIFKRFNHGDAADSAAAGAVDRFATWMAWQNKHLGDWLSQAQRAYPRWITIAQVAFRPKPSVEQDILMAGDAAGLIVPLAGDGISMALEGGMLAAGYASAYLNGEFDAADLRRGYTRAWGRRFGTRLRLGRALQPLLLAPALASPVLRLLGVLPPLGRYLLTRTRGRA